MPVISCPECGARVPDEPICLCMPGDARCRKEHSVKPGCPYGPLLAKLRGPWVLEVFKPVPQEEADALRDYID